MRTVAGSSENMNDRSCRPAVEPLGNTHRSSDNVFDPMQIHTEGFEAFGFLTAELFDPSLFSGLGMNMEASFLENPIE